MSWAATNYMDTSSLNLAPFALSVECEPSTLNLKPRTLRTLLNSRLYTLNISKTAATLNPKPQHEDGRICVWSESAAGVGAGPWYLGVRDLRYTF